MEKAREIPRQHGSKGRLELPDSIQVYEEISPDLDHSIELAQVVYALSDAGRKGAVHGSVWSFDREQQLIWQCTACKRAHATRPKLQLIEKIGLNWPTQKKG